MKRKQIQFHLNYKTKDTFRIKIQEKKNKKQKYLKTKTAVILTNQYVKNNKDYGLSGRRFWAVFVPVESIYYIFVH